MYRNKQLNWNSIGIRNVKNSMEYIWRKLYKTVDRWTIMGKKMKKAHAQNSKIGLILHSFFLVRCFLLVDFLKTIVIRGMLRGTLITKWVMELCLWHWPVLKESRLVEVMSANCNLIQSGLNSWFWNLERKKFFLQKNLKSI